MISKTLRYWLPMIAIAFANAAIRELLIRKYYSEFRAHQLSTFTLIIFCMGYIKLIFRRLDITSAATALKTGMMWVVLTVVFEVAVGVGSHKTTAEMLQNYHMAAGYLWPLFLLTIGICPFVFYHLRRQ